MKFTYTISVCCLLLFSACVNNLLENNYNNTITGNFNALWNEFDLVYGAFNPKKINWDSLKIVYGSTLTDESSESDLYTAMCGLISELNDGHVYLQCPRYNLFESWNRRDYSFYIDVQSKALLYANRSAAIKNHLQPGFKSDTISDVIHYFGVIHFNGSKIGYINIPTFETGKYNGDFIQQAVDTFNLLDGVVIDLRFNPGGNSENSAHCLNSFASEHKIYMKSRFRNGPLHSDFSEMYDTWVNPHKNCLKNKPVVVLMNRFTISASEIFILGIKTQSLFFTVGDTSHGGFSFVRERILPNGWKYTTCSEVLYKPDGSLLVDSNGNYLEGIGIAPDYYVPDYYYRILNGNDFPLDTALNKLSMMIKPDN
jgi:carboxyl-terminal processing protease